MNDVFRANEKKRAHAANGSHDFAAALHGREARSTTAIRPLGGHGG
jgi:hypothetical protein